MSERHMICCIACSRCDKWATATGGGICEACAIRETHAAEIARLQAELAAAREGSERLLKSLQWSESYWPEPEESRHSPDCCCYDCEVRSSVEAARAAIDAARKGDKDAG
jgi:hypothetical protein